ICPTPALLVPAARPPGRPRVRPPLNRVHLVRAAPRPPPHPPPAFAALLGRALQALQDHEGFAASELHTLLDQAQRRRRRGKHDPHGGAPEGVTAQAFAQARQRMPSAFWGALFILLGEQFQPRYADLIRWPPLP